MSDINTLPATNEEDAGEPGAKAPRTRERQATAPLQEHLPAAPLPTGHFPMTAEDHLEHPLGEPLHTIFGTGGDPGGRYDMIWNMTGTLRATFTDPLHAVIALVDERCAPAVPLALPPWGYADRWKHGAVGTPKASVARDVHRCPMRQDRDSLAAERTDILQSPGLVSMSVADVANSISVGDLG
eukprot:gene10288-12168_t